MASLRETLPLSYFFLLRNNTVEVIATNTSASFLVCWNGNDVGAGIAGYDIYASTNRGPWGLWLANTTNSCARP